MANVKFDLQTKFLDEIIQSGQVVTIYTTNGVPLKCKILGHDNFTILIDSRGQQQMLGKGAISTIVK
ncbi:RNA chaperone Hfq [Calidifontibacillus oryziterrae]|uniref:RNA chaperone Hfq n=1 Tax=Calidifontibacillus oryziterrae TaxID=1191699 RepID=UPI0002D89743|nr:RNA chaperone Hfq [Calidifontibacillus oryziterrae]